MTVGIFGACKLVIDTRVTWILGVTPDVLLLLRDQVSYATDPTIREAWRKAPSAWRGRPEIRVLMAEVPGQPPCVPSGLAGFVEHQLRHFFRLSVEVEDRRPALVHDQDILRVLKPVPLDEYQQGAVEICVRSVDGVVEMPPRAGKTRTGIEIVRRMDRGTVWITPTSGLVTQTVRAAREFLGDHEVEAATAANAAQASNALLAITTAAGVPSLPASFWRSRRHVVVDEGHHFPIEGRWAQDLDERTQHVDARHALTATYFRSSDDDLALCAFAGPVRYRVTTTQLRDLGRLVPTRVAFLSWQGKRVPGSTFVGPESVFKLGLWQHEERNALVASVAAMLAYAGRRTIVLCSTREQGQALVDLITPLLPAQAAQAVYGSCELVTGQTKRLDRVLTSFIDHGVVKVLVGTTVIGEGIDLPTADALVFARGGKAEVSLTQSWFRVCTASPGKREALVVDFSDTHNRLLASHAGDRLTLARQEPLFQVSQIPDIHNLSRWIAGAA